MGMSRNGFAKRVEHRAVEEGGGRHGNDIIFPNIDMCLITLVGRFSQSPTKKKIDPGSLVQIRHPLDLNLEATPSKTATQPCNYFHPKKLNHHTSESKVTKMLNIFQINSRTHPKEYGVDMEEGVLYE